MKILTLVRQVPDAETTLCVANGRIDLSRTELQLDTMDEYGVEQALRLREADPETTTEIIALAVGPTSAERALRSALALGADRAIHVLTPDSSDLFLDPIALSSVVAQIAAAESIDLTLLGGRQADWDSEALGPAIAQRLDWPQLTWTTQLELHANILSGRHDIDDGSEAFSVPLPAVVTTQQGLNEPRYPTLPNIMKARKKDLRTEPLANFAAQPLIRILKTELQSRDRLRNIVRAGDDPAAAVATFVEVLRKEAPPQGSEALRMILVIASSNNGCLARSTYELVSAARQFDPSDSLAILVLGSSVDALANEAALLADQVLVADHPSFAAFDPETWAAAVASIASEGEARLVLIAATRNGRAYSPRVAVRLNAPLLEDIITLTSDGAAITAQRYSFLARATETISTTIATTSPTAIAILQPAAFPVATPSTTPAEQFDVELTPTPSRVTTSGRRTEASTRVSLADAEIVVAGGRGLGSAQAFDTLLVPLAETLHAAIGATRAVIDAGWRPYTEQVGQTGKTVQPKIYLALGISGAAQHLSGMNRSKLILAINKDPDAPIFTIADYGIIGDLARILPSLLDRLREP